MPTEQSLAQLQSLLRELCLLPNETEWVEFKHNNADAPMVGEYMRIVLISCKELAKLMLRYNIGSRDEQVLSIKELMKNFLKRKPVNKVFTLYLRIRTNFTYE